MKEKAKEERQKEVTQKISQAYKTGLKTLDEAFEQLVYEKGEGN